jgi:glycosyl transferase family 25
MLLSMKIYVINLPKSEDRRSYMQQQMEAAGVEFEFFAALNGEQAVTDWFDGYNEREFLISTGRRSSEGEKGCYASHLALWKRCVELGEPVMIMEDDVKLAPNFSAAVEATASLIGEHGSIRLQDAPRRAETKVKDVGDFTLYRYRRMPHGTMCYALTPAVAKALISHSAVINEPVDVLTKKFWQHKQVMYALLPYTVGISDIGDDSTVQERQRESKSLDIKVHRVFRKIAWGFLRHWNNFKYAVTGRY